MSSHTPGPWYYHALLSGSENHKGFRVGDKFLIAKVIPVDQDGAEGEANARLIAASPDLLKALEGIRHLVGYEWLLPEFDQARDAIAKATGTSA